MESGSDRIRCADEIGGTMFYLLGILSGLACFLIGVILGKERGLWEASVNIKRLADQGFNFCKHGGGYFWFTKEDLAKYCLTDNSE